MKNSIQQLLEQNYSRTSNAEITKVINGIYHLIGEDAFAEITGVQIDELEDLGKKDLIGVINQINDNYEPAWEELLSSISNTGYRFLKDFMALRDAIESNDNEVRSMDGDSAADAGFAAELGNLPLEDIFSGALESCNKAQTNASLATVNFIKEVGFSQPATEGDRPELIMVDFSHNRKSINPDYDPADPASNEYLYEEINLEVPFISLFNPPSMRIETCDIDLNVKLNSVYTKNITTDFKLDASLGVQLKKVKFDISASYRRTASTGVRVEKEYTLGVHVKATNDAQSIGFEKIMGALVG